MKLLFNILFATLCIIGSSIHLSCKLKSAGMSEDQNILKLLESNKDVVVKNKSFAKELDLTMINNKIMINKEVQQIQIKSALVFENCTFDKRVLFFKQEQNGTILTSWTGPVVFIDCTFNDEVDMRSCSFLNKINFTGSHFLKKFLFEDTKVVLDAVFTNVIFDEDALFQNTHFYDHANFYGAQAKKSLSLQNVYAQRDLNCNMLKTYGYTDLSLIKIYGDAYFTYAEFNDRLYMSNAMLYGKTMFNSNRIKKGTIKNNVFINQFLFDKTIIENEVIIESNTHTVPPRVDKMEKLQVK